MGSGKSISKEKNLLIKSRTENLSAVRNFITSAVEEVNVPKDVAADIVLAVDEACTNIIKHAYKFNPDGDIDIHVKYSSKKIEVKITDRGSSFHPENVPIPDLKKYFEEKRVGGLGMYLMKSLMDDVRYKSIPGEYNQVLLTKKLNFAS